MSEPRYFYRITWKNGPAQLERCPYGGTWDANGVIVRDATDSDRADMTDGRIQYDPSTHPGTLAWAKHVAEGGD